MAEQRAQVRVVSGADRDAVPISGHGPTVEGPVREAAEAPPQELTEDLGGNALRAPSPEDIAEAEGGSLADRMRARFEARQSTKEFGVPGWELPDGRPGLIVEARAFGDRKAWGGQVSNEAFIARSTHRLYFVNDDGSREEVAGGWGPTLAGMMGVHVVKATDLVALVISKPDPSNPGQNIPNVAGIGALATEIVAWASQGVAQAEDALGE